MNEDQSARPPAGARTAEPTAERPVPQTWCHWHGGYTDTGRLISVEEQCSGPGAHRYACAACRKQHRLTLWEATA